MSVTAAGNAKAAPDLREGPRIAWPAQITEQRVRQWVSRRLRGATEIRTDMYHHPMLGVAFRWERPLAQPLHTHALVDLVGGRAYVAEHWDDIDFVAIDQVKVSSQLSPPVQAVATEQAEAAARRLIDGVLLRRRRLDFAGHLRQYGKPLLFGKPNWWIQGVYQTRKLEAIIDGLNGNHYVFSA